MLLAEVDCLRGSSEVDDSGWIAQAGGKNLGVEMHYCHVEQPKTVLSGIFPFFPVISQRTFFKAHKTELKAINPKILQPKKG